MKIIKSTEVNVAHWPWGAMDLEGVCVHAFEGEIYMPNIGFIKIDKDNAWEAKLDDAANSKRLWINSLVTPHVLLKVGRDNKNISYVKLAKELIKSYFSYVDNKYGVFVDAWKDEHSVSNRLFVLTAFLVDSLFFDDHEDLLSQLELLYWAERHANWLAKEENYVKNNHGVMMDLALLQFGLFIRNSNNAVAEKYIQIALSRLNMMFDLTFDSNGCCTENSPAYHFVNYSLFNTIHNFLHVNGLLVNYEKWSSILKQALNVGNLLMRSDRTIPTIGDSEKIVKTFFPFKNEKNDIFSCGFYPKAGFFVSKSHEFQLTMRAGGCSYSHRHIDDLSVTLWAHGVDFIVDAGIYNYDIKDKMRRWFISARAHNMLYLESFGDVRYSNFISPSDMSRFLSFEEHGKSFKIEAENNISKEAKVFRKVDYSDSLIKIEDSFDSEIEQSWRFQLLLHPNVICEQSGESMILKNLGKSISIDLEGDVKYKFLIENSFYSDSFMKVHPTKMLVIKGRSCSARIKCLLRI